MWDWNITFPFWAEGFFLNFHLKFDSLCSGSPCLRGGTWLQMRSQSLLDFLMRFPLQHCSFITWGYRNVNVSSDGKLSSSRLPASPKLQPGGCKLVVTRWGLAACPRHRVVAGCWCVMGAKANLNGTLKLGTRCWKVLALCLPAPTSCLFSHAACYHCELYDYSALFAY